MYACIYIHIAPTSKICALLCVYAIRVLSWFNREESEVLRGRDRDAAELRSLMEERRGVSREVARRAEAARARAQRAEGEVERLRAECASLG